MALYSPDFPTTLHMETAMTLSARKLLVNGVNLNVVIAGENNPGLPVLLVHGFPDTHQVWRKQIPALVEAGYRVIAPDTRGCGDSDMPQRVSAYRAETVVADLVAVLDALGIERVKLIGHDWGAALCWIMAARYPERVERYIALSVGHLDSYARGGLAQKLKGWYVLVFQLRGFAEWLVKAGNWWLFRMFTNFPEEFESHWRPLLSRPGRLTAGMNYYRANLSMIFPRGLPHAAMPVYGIYSTGDRFLSERQMVQSVNYVDAPFTYRRIEGANHWLQLDAPQQVNPLLLEFLQ